MAAVVETQRMALRAWRVVGALIVSVEHMMSIRHQDTGVVLCIKVALALGLQNGPFTVM